MTTERGCDCDECTMVSRSSTLPKALFALGLVIAVLGWSWLRDRTRWLW